MEKATPCPNCHYIRQSKDQHVHAGLCPNCGIAYQKWKNKTDNDSNPSLNAVDERKQGQSVFVDQSQSFFSRLINTFLYVPEKVSEASFYGRAFLWAIFSVWGGYFILGGIDWQRIGGSFLHNVILPFHEFGHVLFIPFGQFMSILGGSLFQVTMPLALLLVFSLKNRDNFAAGLMLWWSGQSFIDISPYILDARYRALPLIGGNESGHDWGNMLTMTNSLDKTEFIAYTAFFIGSSLIVVSVVWMGYVLLKMKSKRVI